VFQSLSRYSEFQDVIAARTKGVKKRAPNGQAVAPSAKEAAPPSHRSEGTRVAILVGIMTAFCALVWLVWKLLH
jgi:hypothetical protein